MTPDPMAQEVASGANFSFDVDYTTSPVEPNLTGLGLRVHFDSTQVEFVGFSNVLATGFPVSFQ